MYYCRSCKFPTHPGKSCSEYIEKRYAETMVAYVGTLKYTVCVKCNLVIKRGPYCNHFTCDSCMFSFCMYCRNPFDKDHLNLMSSNPCEVYFKQNIQSLQENKKRKQKYQEFIEHEKIKNKYVMICLLIWLVVGLIVSIPLALLYGIQGCQNFVKTSRRPYLKQ